jgi:basic membrane protein A
MPVLGGADGRRDGMNVKRMGSSWLLLVALVGTACSSNGGSGGGSGNGPVKMAILLPCPINDQSWCQQAYSAVNQLKTEGAVALKYLENAPQDSAAAQQVLSQYANGGYQLVVGDSTTYIEPVMKVAPKFPATNFAAADSPNLAKNVSTYVLPIYQAAYLAGILATGITKTGKIGGVAAFDIPVCHAELEAFELGAKSVRPDITELKTYVGDFTDPTPSKEATLAQADQGADVFVACGGGPSQGMGLAIKDRNLSGFSYVGDNSSLAPNNFVGALVWNLYPTFKAMVDDVKAGSFQPGKKYPSGIKEGTMELKLNPQYSVTSIPAETTGAVQKALADIKSGALEVPFITK